MSGSSSNAATAGSSSGTSIGGPSTISEVLASWTDLDTLTDVEDFSLPIGSPSHTRWSFRDIKSHFEKHNSDPSEAILCRRLPSGHIPEIAFIVNEGRKNNGELMRLKENDPLWFARRMLGQHGTGEVNLVMEFDMWIWVEHGTVLVSWKINDRELREGEKELTYLTLGKGDKMILPKTTVTFLFMEDALLTTGNIVLGPVSS